MTWTFLNMTTNLLLHVALHLICRVCFLTLSLFPQTTYLSFLWLLQCRREHQPSDEIPGNTEYSCKDITEQCRIIFSERFGYSTFPKISPRRGAQARFTSPSFWSDHGECISTLILTRRRMTSPSPVHLLL